MSDIGVGDVVQGLHSAQCTYGGAHPIDEDCAHMVGQFFRVSGVSPPDDVPQYPGILAWISLEGHWNEFCAGCFRKIESDPNLEHITTLIKRPVRIPEMVRVTIMPVALNYRAWGFKSQAEMDAAFNERKER